MIVYVSIGNSDDKLAQAEWSEFYELTRELLVDLGLTSEVHGAWASLPNAAWQNACWCVDVKPEHADTVKDTLRRLAHKFRQDSIAWNEANPTEFLGGQS